MTINNDNEISILGKNPTLLKTTNRVPGMYSKKLSIILIFLLLSSPVLAKPKHNKQKSLPPGLAKKVQNGGELPPGWQKKIAKGEVLDVDVYRNAVPLSKEEQHKYSSSKTGTKLLKIENKIIRVMDATRTIIDVFEIGDK